MPGTSLHVTWSLPDRGHVEQGPPGSSAVEEGWSLCLQAATFSTGWTELLFD